MEISEQAVLDRIQVITQPEDFTKYYATIRSDLRYACKLLLLSTDVYLTSYEAFLQSSVERSFALESAQRFIAKNREFTASENMSTYAMKLNEASNFVRRVIHKALADLGYI